MESAIDAHLKCPRTRTRRVEDDFQPPYPAFSARAPQTMTQVVMGYFGVQLHGGGEAIETAFKAVNALLDLPDGPGHSDTVRYVDGDGYDTAIAVAYWGRHEAILALDRQSTKTKRGGTQTSGCATVLAISARS